MLSVDVTNFLQALRVDAKKLRDDPNLAGKVQQYFTVSSSSTVSSGATPRVPSMAFTPLATAPCFSISWKESVPEESPPPAPTARRSPGENFPCTPFESATGGIERGRSDAGLESALLDACRLNNELSLKKCVTSVSCPSFRDAFSSGLDGNNAKADRPPHQILSDPSFSGRAEQITGVTLSQGSATTPPDHSASLVPVVTSVQAVDPLGAWRRLLGTSCEMLPYPGGTRLTSCPLPSSSQRSAETEEAIEKERAIRDYLRRLFIFSRGYDDPTSSVVEGAGTKGADPVAKSNTSERTSCGALLWFADPLYNGAALGQLIHTILSWATHAPNSVHHTMTGGGATRSFHSSSFSSFSKLPPLSLHLHRFPRNATHVQENYLALMSLLRGEEALQPYGAILGVPSEMLYRVHIEEVYLCHRHVPLLEVYTFLIREHLPPPEKLPLPMGKIPPPVPVDASGLEQLKREDDVSSEPYKEASNTWHASFFTPLPSTVQRRLTTYAACERFLCQFLVTHHTLPDPDTYQLPSDDCLVPGPLQAKFLFSPSPSPPQHYHHVSSRVSSRSLSVFPSLPFFTTENSFIPRRSPPPALFIPSVFPFLTNGVALLRLAASLRPPRRWTTATTSWVTPTVLEQETARFYKRTMEEDGAHPRLWASWRQCSLNPKTPLRCQVNIAVALQWLFTDEKERWIGPQKDFCKDGVPPRSERHLRHFPLCISQLSTAIYEGDRLCLVEVLWNAVKLHRQSTSPFPGISSSNPAGTAHPVSSLSLVNPVPMDTTRRSPASPLHQPDAPAGSPLSSHVEGPFDPKSRNEKLVSHWTDPHEWRRQISSKRTTASQLLNGSRFHPFLQPDRPSLRTTGEAFHSSALFTPQCRASRGHRSTSRRREESGKGNGNAHPVGEMLGTCQEEKPKKQQHGTGAAEGLGSMDSSSNARVWVEREVQGLRNWFLSVVGGPRFHYVARDESFVVHGAAFEFPIPILSPSPSPTSPKCLIFSDGVVLAHLIRILERRRCDALNCVKPSIKRAAKRFNISRCIRFLREDCGISSPVLWILEEPLLDGDPHAVLSLIKLLRQHYTRHINTPLTMPEE